MTFEELKKELPAIKQKIDSGEYSVVVIDGPQGPTGKTTAANFLRDNGIPVFEEYQMFYIRIGWMPKPKTSIMMWHEFVRDAGKICKMIKKGWYGYQGVIVDGTRKVDDVLEILWCNRIKAYKESEVMRLEFSDYISPAMRHQNFKIH